MPISLQQRLFNALKRVDFVTLDEATALGVNKMMLSRLVKSGELLRPARSIYATNLDWLSDPLRRYAPACTLYPGAVICGVSALLFYDLSDEYERSPWLAFPYGECIKSSDYHVTCFRAEAYAAGIESHRVGKRHVRIYDREKSVIDAFKLLPVDVAHKALRGYLKQPHRDLKKLTAYGRQLRKPIDDIVALLLSDE